MYTYLCYNTVSKIDEDIMFDEGWNDLSEWINTIQDYGYEEDFLIVNE